MKIAVNKCFGGFDLSDAAHEKLIELGVKHYKNWDEIPEKNEDPYVVNSNRPDDIFGKYFSNFKDYEKRTHPLLLQVIEELKEEASGRFGKIEIVEVPDGINWEIEDYDGIETIHEVHRSW